MQIYLFLVGFRNDSVKFDGKCHVKEVDRLGGGDFINVPLQNSKIVNVVGKGSPFQFIANPNTKDVINVAFEVEQEVTIFWNDGVNFVVCKI